MDLATRLDLYAIGRDYVLSHAKRIDPRQVDVAGSDVNLFVGAGSVMAAAVMNQLAYALSQVFLASAEGDDLYRWAYDRYGLLPKTASTALGSVVLTRPTALGGIGTVAAGARLRTAGGADYVTTTSATFGSSDLVATAKVRAVLAGKATQTGANTIVKIVDPLFDRALTVNNPLPTAGGEDAETEDAFRERVRGFWRAARRGVLPAIEQGALDVPGVASALAIEALNADNTPARVVTLYIADSSGVASAELGQLVRDNLFDYRGAGIAVLVRTSMPQILPVVLALTFRAGADTDALAEQVRVGVVEYVNNRPVNGGAGPADLYGVLQRFAPDGLLPTLDSIVAPTGYVVPALGRTLRTTLDYVTLAPGSDGAPA